MYSGDALTLWKMYRDSGDDYYLDLLIEYNEEDVINLRYIADLVYKKLKETSEGCSYTSQENRRLVVQSLF